MSIFQHIFSKRQQPTVSKRHTDPIPIGEPFPSINTTFQKGVDRPALFISLTCRDCVKLLEQLPRYNGPLLLYILNASEEELKELNNYFRFDFPVIRIDERVRKDVYKIPTTPFVYYIDRNGYVSDSEVIHSIEELSQ